ncbi:MAG: choline monooxygenase [Cyclobacteriaceae bacterium]|nr:MAG: choline monooxygenase [Cyclobacteriaceae bacterium]
MPQPRFSVSADISRAHTLHADFYTRQEFFESAKEKIFAHTWQFLHTTESLKEPGSVMPVTLLPDFLNEPLVITLDRQENLHVLSNVCTHRGALIASKPCTLHELRCPYHGRRFDLTGKFLSMPEFKEVQNFPTEADNLHELPAFVTGNLVFTILQPKIEANLFFGDMLQRMHWFNWQALKYRPDLSKDYEVKAHWALYCENYLEGFHIPFVHASLNRVIDFSEYRTELFAYSSLQLGIARANEIAFDLPPSSADYGKRVAGYYFFVFPNMMFNFYPWGLSLNIVKPVTPQKTIVSFLTFISDDRKYNQGAGSGLHQVELEDEAVVESVQQGIRSRFYSTGRYSVKHEKGTHHFHRLIASFLG